MTHICDIQLSYHWSRLWLVAWPAPSHYLNQCRNIVNWTMRNKFQWKFHHNTTIFIQENAFENVVWKMVVICLGLNVLRYSTRSIHYGLRYHNPDNRSSKKKSPYIVKFWVSGTKIEIFRFDVVNIMIFWSSTFMVLSYSIICYCDGTPRACRYHWCVVVDGLATNCRQVISNHNDTFFEHKKVIKLWVLSYLYPNLS